MVRIVDETVYKGSSIYKLTNLTKWRCIRVKMQCSILVEIASKISNKIELKQDI